MELQVRDVVGLAHHRALRHVDQGSRRQARRQGAAPRLRSQRRQGRLHLSRLRLHGHRRPASGKCRRHARLDGPGRDRRSAAGAVHEGAQGQHRSRGASQADGHGRCQLRTHPGHQHAAGHAHPRDRGGQRLRGGIQRLVRRILLPRSESSDRLGDDPDARPGLGARGAATGAQEGSAHDHHQHRSAGEVSALSQEGLR